MTVILRIRLVLLASFLALLGLLAVPTLALAQGAPITVDDAGQHFVVSSVWWTAIVGSLIPFLLELAQKANLNPFWKQILSLLAAGVATLVIRATQTDGSGVIDQSMLLDFLVTFAFAFFAHRTLIRNTRLNGGILPNFGIGPKAA